ncbi:MAG: glycosyltransferase family 39 protein, partial [Thermoanaerobaculia bacterium]
MRARTSNSEPNSVPVTRWEIATGAGLLVLMVVLAWPGLIGNSVTIDEFAHMPAGYVTLQEGALGVYSKTPPLVRSLEALPWLALRPQLSPGILERLDPYDPWHPWILGDDVMRLNPGSYDRLFILSRLVTLALALVGGVLVWVWSRQVFGPQGGILSLALFATSPTILAHSSVATVDVGSAVLFSATLFALWRFLQLPSPKRALVCGLLLGAALLAKMTALILLPLVVVITLAALLIPPRADRNRIRSLLGGLAIVLATAILLLNLAYGFRGSFASWTSHDLFSQTLGRATGWLPSWTPTGLPSWYVFGLDTQLLDLEQGEFPGYLLGEWSQEGRWQYFPVAIASKETLPFLLLFVASLAALAGRRQRRDLLTELCLLLPMVTVVAIAMRGGRLQIGIRYLLPIYPLIFVHLGRLALVPQGFAKARARRIAALVIAGLVGLQAVTISLAGPDYLSY